MLKRWFRCLPAGLILAALVMAILWLAQPRSFSEVARLQETTSLYVYTTDETPQRNLLESQPERDEAEPLLMLLESGTLRLKGFCRTISWETDQSLYHLYLDTWSPEGEWQGYASLALRSDGMLYKSVGEWGYLRYELSGCDMDAVLAELAALPGMT